MLLSSNTVLSRLSILWLVKLSKISFTHLSFIFNFVYIKLIFFELI